MRFTNLCGMTIPERMVALQEMMQELIDAIYAEYRWTAIVSHVSETNVFTANDVINFDDSDFIIGQTVLFTDGYLGVVIEVDNSVTPKQFTAGHYIQLKGDKGDSGINGTNGKNGLDSPTYKGIYVIGSVPSTTISFLASNFNRSPVVGDVFNIVFRGIGSVLNRSWLGTYKVISLGASVAICSGGVVETTGEKGGSGGDTRYVHNITINRDTTDYICFQFTSTNENAYDDINQIGVELSSLGFSSVTGNNISIKSATGEFSGNLVIGVIVNDLSGTINCIMTGQVTEIIEGDVTIKDIVEMA